jgi:CheY-like chemotaxis protein
MDANHHSRPLRLLVIEDNLDIAENIGDYFQARGGILDFAMDGIGGLHLALTHPYDVIILDIMLPGMDGLTLCRKLRKEAVKAPPVLMLTARDTLNDKLEGFASGADDYLVKPFALQDSLSNFANGLMILFFRPFDVDHFVEAGGVSGKVETLNLVSTTIKTLDNRLVVVPNNKVWQDVITNSSAFDERRVDMEFGTGYNDDIDKAQAIL